MKIESIALRRITLPLVGPFTTSFGTQTERPCIIVTVRAIFADTHRLSMGIRDVWINGVGVLSDGAHTGATPSRIVAGPGRP